MAAIVNDWSEEERRQQERFSLDHYLKVIDQDTQTLLGHIVDISMGGIKVLGEHPIEAEKKFHLLFDISLGDGKQTHVTVEARSIWTAKDINPGFHTTGFCFLELSNESYESVSSLIAVLSG